MTIDSLHLNREERAAIDAVLTLIADARSDRSDLLNRPEPSAPPPSRLLTVPETAATLGTCKATVYNLMDRGELRWIQVAGKRRVSTAEIERFVEAHTES